MNQKLNCQYQLHKYNFLSSLCRIQTRLLVNVVPIILLKNILVKIGKDLVLIPTKLISQCHSNDFHYDMSKIYLLQLNYHPCFILLL